MIFPEQIRAGRALVGISQADLAERAGVGVATVKRIEAVSGRVRGAAASIWRIQQALEAAGVTFLEASDNCGPGVRLTKPL